MENSCKFRGGLRSGNLNATWPFASMEISKEHIEIKSILGNHKFRPDDISAILKHHGIFSQGLKIIHHTGELIFWTFQRKTVLQCLSDFGYAGKFKKTVKNKR